MSFGFSVPNILAAVQPSDFTRVCVALVTGFAKEQDTSASRDAGSTMGDAVCAGAKLHEALPDCQAAAMAALCALANANALLEKQLALMEGTIEAALNAHSAHEGVAESACEVIILETGLALPVYYAASFWDHVPLRGLDAAARCVPFGRPCLRRDCNAGALLYSSTPRRRRRRRCGPGAVACRCIYW